MAEIQAGIEKIREQDPEKARDLEAWADLIMRTRKVIPMDGITFMLWARLMHRREQHLYEDAMIVATALRNELVVVTRNVRDFASFEVDVFDPFST